MGAGKLIQIGRWLASPLGQLQMLIALAVALGGGGVGYGLRNLVIQLVALLVLWLQRDAVRAFASAAPRALVALLVLTLALPLVQIIPLPPGLWQSLPGRGQVSEAFAVADIDPDVWFPLSMDRGRTLTAFFGLAAPAAIVLVGTVLDSFDKIRLARMVAWAALAALLLGITQLTSANTSAILFDMTFDPAVLYATFANRNSGAAFFVLALLLLAATPVPRSVPMLIVTVACGGLLAMGAILTQSRSGMVLLVLAAGFAAMRAGFAIFVRRGEGDAPPGWLAGVAAAVLVLVAVLGSMTMGGRAADALDRFGDTETDRPEMWEDAAFAARGYWPVGSGMGTFDEVFQLHESLEYITPRRAGRAHSDVIEIVIEAGAFGAALAIGWLVWCAQAALRATPHWRWTALGAGTGVLMLLLQSLLDYPLRNQTLLCLAAVLVVLLARRREKTA